MMSSRCQRMFQRSCLKPTFSLRRQLLISFGSSSLLMLSMVVVVSCLYAYQAGLDVKKSVQSTTRAQVVDNFYLGARNQAASYTQRSLNIDSAVQIIVEIVRDRIVGYPFDGDEGEGLRLDTNHDAYVPFLDSDSGRPKYPLDEPPLPVDWQIYWNVVPDTAREHLQERVESVNLNGAVSTATASWFVRGTCDPSVKDNAHAAYFNNCTEANNNLSAGGVVEPTRTARFLHDVSGDIGILLKPLFEGQPDVSSIFLAFVNDGAGAAMQFPGRLLPSSSAYVSEGCDWLATTMNPYTNRPLGSPAQVAKCHPAGTVVSGRDYNALDRAWFRVITKASVEDAQSQIPPSYGPFPVLGPNDRISVVAFGRAIFDRRTGEFIGVASVLSTQHDIESVLQRVELHEQSSDYAIVNFESGAIWADTVGTYVPGQAETVLAWETNQLREDEWAHLKGALKYGEGEDSLEEIDERMKAATFSSRGSVKIAYPLPKPPKQYDPNYRPVFIAVHSLPEDEIDRSSLGVCTEIRNDTFELLGLSIGIGIAGILLILVTVWCVSGLLTHKLIWVEGVASNIVYHADATGKQVGDHKKSDRLKLVRAFQCLPQDEISQIVDEFNKMVKDFIGSGAAKVADAELAEVKNEFTWHSEFRKLYTDEDEVRDQNARTPKSFKRVSFSEQMNTINSFDASEAFSLPADLYQDSSAFSVMSRFPRAPRLRSNERNIKQGTIEESYSTDRRIKVWRSPLFWGIFLLLTTPLIVINGIICRVIISKTKRLVPEWLDMAEHASVELELASLQTLARSKAQFAEISLQEPVRNIHLLTRVAGWLFFDSVNRADSFTEVEQGTEECKVYPKDDRSCPFYSPERAPCPCAWSDFDSNLYCSDAFDASTNTRNLQKSIFAVQASDADPVTGDRMSADSYPVVDDFPNTTSWRDHIEALPGAEKGANASGFSTTYDRLRVVSAMAVVEFPIYNHITALRRENHILGTYMAFHQDGLFVGFPGCDYGPIQYSHFQSNDANRAAEVSPQLCPKGKYGYDPRCRNWYQNGLHTFTDNRQVLHVTAPYEFVRGSVGTSAVSPIVNLPTNEIVGNVLYDFLTSDIRDSFSDVRGDVVMYVVTPTSDVFEHDTVVGPNQRQGLESARIEDLIFPLDDENSTNRKEFQASVLSNMKTGEQGVGRYRVTGESEEQDVFIVAYAPVRIRSLLPLRHDDVTRGVATTYSLVYSVAAAVREQDLLQPFRNIEANFQEEAGTTNATFLSVIFAVSVLFVAFTCMVTAVLVWPLVLLLKTLQRINQGEAERIPPLQGGSLEVRHVYSTFAKLCRAVRTSNTAFFSGNIELASHIIDNTLKLYRKVNNSRAVGVACNNLANTFYATMHNSKVHGIASDRNTSCSDLLQALSLYDEAIAIAESDFESEVNLTEKALFSEQLADRLFNRGLFLLLAQGEDRCPSNARERGLADISRARQLDYDVRGYWIEEGVVMERSAILFSRMVRRLHGLVTFYDDDDLRLAWDASELVKDADDLLFACTAEPTSGVWQDLTLTGRLQQLEAAVICLEMWLKNFPEAARMGIRMFAEDGFLLETSFQIAAAAILQLNKESAEPLFADNVVSSLQADIRKMLNSCKNRAVISTSKCAVVCLEISESWDLDPLLERINAHFLRLYDEAFTEDDSMGLVSFSDQGDGFSFGLGPKSDNAGLHRSTLDIATNSTSRDRSPTLPVALQMIVDAEQSLDCDSYMLLVSDGASLNPLDTKALLDQLQRLNSERSTSIHVVILSLGIQDKRQRAVYMELGALTQDSLFIELDSGNLDSSFRDVTQLLAKDFLIRGDLQGITMEEF